MTACRLIVHADDFGLTPQVNRGIVRAFEEGVLTSASIMACAAAFEDAVALARRTPELDLGIHLTLIEERPLLPPASIPSLVTPEGRFGADVFGFAGRWLRGSIAPDEVRAELEAQMASVADHGLKVSHLDSHQHLHLLPGIAAITVDLARRFGIKAVRLPRERLQRHHLRRPFNAVRLSQMLLLNGLACRSPLRALHTTDSFCGFYDGGRLAKENLLVLLRHLPKDQSCELMCHPGETDVSGRYGHWRYRHAEELAALCDPEVRVFLRDSGVQLISYKQLTEIS